LESRREAIGAASVSERLCRHRSLTLAALIGSDSVVRCRSRKTRGGPCETVTSRTRT